MSIFEQILSGIGWIDVFVVLVLSIVQLGAGLAVGALLWRTPRQRWNDIHIPPYRKF